MISFALILMTLPSRVAGVRARHGESSTGRANAAQHGLSSTGVDSSLHERCSGVCVKSRSSKTRPLAQAPLQLRNDSGENEGTLNLWRR
jgi:hypothetical protein